MSKTSKFIFGAFLGAIATALLTPITGKKTRQKLQKTAKKVKTDKRISEVLDKSLEIFEKAKNSAENKIKEQTKARGIKYTHLLNKKIKKVAICGGSGSFLINSAKFNQDFNHPKIDPTINQIIAFNIAKYVSLSIIQSATII